MQCARAKRYLQTRGFFDFDKPP